MMSSQLNGLWGEAFHVIVKSHLSLLPTQDGNKKTDSSIWVPMTSMSCDGRHPPKIALLEPLPPADQIGPSPGKEERNTAVCQIQLPNH